MKTTRRKSNLELLRILSMFLIVVHHFAVHSSIKTTLVNHIILDILSIGGKLGVNMFVLITGYFMVNSVFKVEKFIWIFTEVTFYSIFIMLVFYIFNFTKLTAGLILVSLFPLLYNLYWFATVYMLMYIFIPFINMFLGKISRHQHKFLIITLISVWSVIPTFTAGVLYFSYVGWFISLYITAAYIRMYSSDFISKTRYVIIATLSYVLIIFSIVILNIIGDKISVILEFTTYFSKINSTLLLLLTLSLFLIFKNLDMKNNILINKLARSMFAVYLIHDNVFMREYLWNQVFTFSSNIGPFELFLFGIVSSILVFVVSSVIGSILRVFVKVIYNFFVEILVKKNVIKKIVEFIIIKSC